VLRRLQKCADVQAAALLRTRGRLLLAEHEHLGARESCYRLRVSLAWISFSHRVLTVIAQERRVRYHDGLVEQLLHQERSAPYPSDAHRGRHRQRRNYERLHVQPHRLHGRQLHRLLSCLERKHGRGCPAGYVRTAFDEELDFDQVRPRRGPREDPARQLDLA
jgi:hypothetical protein